MVCTCFLLRSKESLADNTYKQLELYILTCALVSSLSGRGTGLGNFVSSTVINEASNGAIPGEAPGRLCLMPACVRAEADAVVGVVVPDDAGEIAAGAIVICGRQILLFSQLMSQS